MSPVTVPGYQKAMRAPLTLQRVLNIACHTLCDVCDFDCKQCIVKNKYAFQEFTNNEIKRTSIRKGSTIK